MCAGAADGLSRLNAFDNALLQAGIGNVNLVRVSSILPPGALHVPDLAILPGTLTPTAYGYITSDVPEDVISAAVGVGMSADSFGVIMEYSGHCSRQDAESTVMQMVKDAFEMRQMEPVRILVKAVEHKVVAIGCAFAAVALWY